MRFSLRGMFIATAAIAVCLAAIGPWLRHRATDERIALAKIWGNVGSLTCESPAVSPIIDS